MLASFGFSWGFIIVRAVDLPAAEVAFLRLLFGGGLLALVALARRTPWHFSGPVFFAGLCFGLHQLFFIRAAQSTSIAVVTLVQSLMPLLVAMVSQRTVGEKVEGALFGCAVLALAGVGLVVYANRGMPSTTPFALLLCVLNLVSFSAFFLFSKRARFLGAPSLTLTCASLVIAWLFVVPFSVGQLTTAVPALWQVGLLAFMAWIPGNGHILVNWAHARVSATLGSIALSLVPVFASIWAHLLFDEPYGLLHVIGTVFTLAAVVLGRKVSPV